MLVFLGPARITHLQQSLALMRLILACAPCARHLSPTSEEHLMRTVAILAQGASWAVAATRAFFWQSGISGTTMHLFRLVRFGSNPGLFFFGLRFGLPSFRICFWLPSLRVRFASSSVR